VVGDSASGTKHRRAVERIDAARLDVVDPAMQIHATLFER
jgi:hypothetical protein